MKKLDNLLPDFMCKREGEQFLFDRDAVGYMYDMGWLTKLESDACPADTIKRVLLFLRKEYMVK